MGDVIPFAASRGSKPPIATGVPVVIVERSGELVPFRVRTEHLTPATDKELATYFQALSLGVRLAQLNSCGLIDNANAELPGGAI